jgi:hypothetical protein
MGVKVTRGQFALCPSNGTPTLCVSRLQHDGAGLRVGDHAGYVLTIRYQSDAPVLTDNDPIGADMDLDRLTD